MSTKKQPVITVKRNEEKPEPIEIIAEAIIEISNAAKKLLGSRLSKRAILLLIKDAAGSRVSMADIELVLNSAAQLEQQYVKKPAK